LRDVLEAHSQALEFGGLAGIRSLALVESAIDRPYSGYYRSIAQKAAALVESLAMNHGFVDGNKRTALLAVTLLVSRSNYQLAPLQGEINSEIEQLILDIVGHRMDFDKVVEWFQQRIMR
jgi:death on curing protein